MTETPWAFAPDVYDFELNDDDHHSFTYLAHNFIAYTQNPNPRRFETITGTTNQGHPYTAWYNHYDTVWLHTPATNTTTRYQLHPARIGHYASTTLHNDHTTHQPPQPLTTPDLYTTITETL